MSEKEQQSLKLVKQYMYYSMGAGLVPIPVLDLVAISGVQMKMLAELSKIYDIPFQESRGKAVVGSLVGYVLPHSLAHGLICSTLKTIPVIGLLAGAPTQALVSGATAWALGNVFIQHFESGGTLLNFDTEKVREYFQAQYEEGRKLAAMKGKNEQDVVCPSLATAADE